MDQLPGELLSSIFVNLHFCEKQECMLVCHQWADVIRSEVLYDTIHINEEYTIGRLGQFLDSHPSRKAQIKNMVVHSPVSQWGCLDYFSNYFPKLRSLYIYSCSSDTIIESNPKENDQRQMNRMTWVSKIEVLEQYHCLHPNQCILSLGMYNALEKLVIHNGGSISIMNMDILANAPNIISLTLGRIEISINDLEKILSNLVLLKYLELHNVILKTLSEDTKTAPELVTPVKSLKTLLITLRHDDANNDTITILRCLQYIQYKCINLLKFRFIIDSTVMIKRDVEEELVECGILPLLLCLDHGLNSLEINCSTALSSLLNNVYALGFKAHSLNIFMHFSLSKDRRISFRNSKNFIQQLTLNINSSKWVSDVLENLKSLKILHIKGMHNFVMSWSYSQYEINLDDIFTSCSNSLESLKIETFHLIYSVQIHHQAYSLTKLEIDIREVFPGVYSFISSFLPHLRYLGLSYCIRATGVVKLGIFNLYRLDLCLIPCAYIKITTDRNNNDRYYHIKNQHKNSTDVKVPDETRVWDRLRQMTPEDAITHLDEMLCFEFNSVQQLYINNMIAY
ncbi:hypothetical protein K501DRAFT_273506 [Backusella circina FSU 941]|nr:hypothetical protein K501DRAFT_273506 [Backusella circina FSU 941]